MSERPGTGVPEINPKEIVNDGTNQSPGLGWQISEETRQRIEALEAERARLREALEWYEERTRIFAARGDRDEFTRSTALTLDAGSRARAALAEHKEH